MEEKKELQNQDERVVEIELERLRGFVNHPFKVQADSQMIELQESIKKYGILNPLIVRPRQDGTYEIISGHRRKFAAEKIGYRKVPVIIRVLKDDEAVVSMVDSNLQREMISPSEKAFAYKMKYEAIKRKAGRRKCGQVDHNLGKKSIELIGEECGDSPKQVQRYIKITELIPEMLEKVDDGSMGFTPAVQLSFLKKKEQKEMLDAMEFAQCTPSLSQALRIKKLSSDQVAIRMVEMPPLFSEEPMNGPAAAVKVMADTFRDYDREVVAVVNLRADMRPININIASIGALDQSIAHPREILKSTILSNAAAIILVHNHPSGRLAPSVEDIGLTDRMNKICDLIGVKLVDHIIVGPGNEFYSFQEKNQMPLASLKLTKDLEDIELEGFRVAENTAVKEEKKVITLTVAECMEFHSMGEFHENIKSVAEAVAKFKAISPERMHGVPAIGIRAADPKDPDEYTEMDVLIGRRIDMDMLRYIPEIADSWQAQQMIASLIHEMPDVKVVGQIPDSIQKKIDWLESRDKRADELQQITDKLEKGVVEVFQSDRYKQFLDTMAKFPRYSVNNSLLIMMQKPDAQLCQSFTGWKQMGRYVKKGEKGISILAPAPYKIEREQTKLDDKGRPVFDADGEPVKEKVEVTIRAFKVVKTFDLSQTDGKELPTIGPSELVGNIEGYPKLLQALQEISPVPVSFELIDGDAKGFYHLEDKKIVVQDGMSEVQTIKTLLHEMAHQKLHDKDNVPEAKDISRNGKEVEAESVAYVVCQHYGINTSDYSFSYVAGWSEGKETPELKASLDKIRQTASEFIYQIDQKMEVLMADKKQVQESAKAPSPFVQELMDKITEGAKDLGFIPVAPETQEKTANPELKVVVDKALKDLDKKRTLSKVKESVKSKLKANTEKAEQAPKKGRTSKAKEERA